MSKLRFKISMSLDGFVAGPSQSVDNPLGIGGERLFDGVGDDLHGLEPRAQGRRAKGNAFQVRKALRG